MVVILRVVPVALVLLTSVYASVPGPREKREEVSVTFNTTDIPYPPNRENIHSFLENAAGVLQNAMTEVDDPDTNVTVDASLKRDLQPSALLTVDQADAPAAEDDAPAERRKRGWVRIRGRAGFDVRIGKKKRAVLLGSSEAELVKADMHFKAPRHIFCLTVEEYCSSLSILIAEK